uniref:Ig-like domain-containing protein n=1 Tax=Naja naja TaxID=35670 RepID=A0A8C6XZL5_NAJNA
QNEPTLAGLRLLLIASTQVVKYHLPIFMDRSNAIEGQRINLTVGAAPTSFFICNWYRGSDSQEKLIVTVYLPPLSGYVFGPAYTGRETPGPNCSLRIENLNQDDSGTYTVTKDGPSVHGTGNHSVEVLGLLPKPNMSTVQLFRENMDLVHLKCETTVKFANISWLQNGKPLSSCPRIQLSNNKQTLTIQPVLRHDAGAYQCQISNPFSAQRSDTTTISVIYGPDPPVIKMTAKSLTQPSNGRLSCKASSFPEAEYCWFHNGKEFSKNPEILLKDIQSGTYTCQATNPFTQALVVQAVKCLALKFQLPAISAGSNPTRLKVDSAFHPLGVGKVRTQDCWGQQNDQTLNFNPCDRRDAANYKCHASNSFSSADSDPFGLIIIYGPDPPVINETINLTEETISLTCLAVSNPASEIEWYFNGQLIPISPEVLTRKIIPENSGDYAFFLRKYSGMVHITLVFPSVLMFTNKMAATARKCPLVLSV